MKFELDFLEPVSDIDIVYTFDEDCPGMSVVLGYSSWFGVLYWIKEFCCCAINEWTIYLYTFKALLCRRRHDDGVVCVYHRPCSEGTV